MICNNLPKKSYFAFIDKDNKWQTTKNKHIKWLRITAPFTCESLISKYKAKNVQKFVVKNRAFFTVKISGTNKHFLKNPVVKHAFENALIKSNFKYALGAALASGLALLAFGIDKTMLKSKNTKKVQEFLQQTKNKISQFKSKDVGKLQQQIQVLQEQLKKFTIQKELIKSLEELQKKNKEQREKLQINSEEMQRLETLSATKRTELTAVKSKNNKLSDQIKNQQEQNTEQLAKLTENTTIQKEKLENYNKENQDLQLKINKAKENLEELTNAKRTIESNNVNLSSQIKENTEIIKSQQLQIKKQNQTKLRNLTQQKHQVFTSLRDLEAAQKTNKTETEKLQEQINEAAILIKSLTKTINDAEAENEDLKSQFTTSKETNEKQQLNIQKLEAEKNELTESLASAQSDLRDQKIQWEQQLKDLQSQMQTTAQEVQDENFKEQIGKMKLSETFKTYNKYLAELEYKNGFELPVCFTLEEITETEFNKCQEFMENLDSQLVLLKYHLGNQKGLVNVSFRVSNKVWTPETKIPESIVKKYLHTKVATQKKYEEYGYLKYTQSVVCENLNYNTRLKIRDYGKSSTAKLNISDVKIYGDKFLLNENVFTGIENNQSSQDSPLNSLKTNLNRLKEEDVVVITSYGVSGAGKTHLMLGSSNTPDAGKGLIQQSLTYIKSQFEPKCINLKIFTDFLDIGEKHSDIKNIKGQIKLWVDATSNDDASITYNVNKIEDDSIFKNKIPLKKDSQKNCLHSKSLIPNWNELMKVLNQQTIQNTAYLIKTTPNNNKSSRGHNFFMYTFEINNTKSTLVFIDLAGVEHPISIYKNYVKFTDNDTNNQYFRDIPKKKQELIKKYNKNMNLDTKNGRNQLFIRLNQNPDLYDTLFSNPKPKKPFFFGMQSLLSQSNINTTDMPIGKLAEANIKTFKNLLGTNQNISGIHYVRRLIFEGFYINESLNILRWCILKKKYELSPVIINTNQKQGTKGKLCNGQSFTKQNNKFKVCVGSAPWHKYSPSFMINNYKRVKNNKKDKFPMFEIFNYFENVAKSRNAKTAYVMYFMIRQDMKQGKKVNKARYEGTIDTVKFAQSLMI
jgi:hypothetical protein